MKSLMPLLLGLIVATGSGCARRFYLDPSFGTARYEDLARPEQPLLLKLTIEDVDDSYRSDDAVREHVASILRKSGLVHSSYAGEDGYIQVKGVAPASKGLYERSGPGLHGRDVSAIAVTIATGGRTVTKEYEYSILWYSPRAKVPEGLSQPMSYEAVDQPLEQMLLRALRDFQQEGVIPTGVNPATAR